MKQLLKGLIIIAEPLLLLLLIVVMWHLPDIRANYVNLLWLIIPATLLRYVIFSLQPVRGVLIISFGVFILLALFNYANAPLHRENFIGPMARPLLGMWVVLYMIDHVRIFKRLEWLLLSTSGLTIVLGTLALTASQWTEKSDDLRFITSALPRVDYRASLPDMLLSFNVNEIAGGMSWLIPLVIGLVAWHKADDQGIGRILRVLSGVAFSLVFLALFLGQSRFAIGGVLVALFISVPIIVRSVPRRRLAYGALIAITLLEGAILFNLFGGQSPTISGRDEKSIFSRIELWYSGTLMTADQPLTGVGMSMFRTASRQERYMPPAYRNDPYPPPHAHNEIIQIGADLGIPGIAIFLFWHGMIAYALWRVIRHDEGNLRIAGGAIGAGLLAHFLFGLGDAVALWDRFTFIFWWLFGLAMATYTLWEMRHISE